MPKRDQTPPYEIMRGRSGQTPTSTGVGSGPAQPPEPGEQSDAYSPGHVPSRAPWWVGSSSPLVLRIPRGLAVLAVVGLLLLIVLAYWVGSKRGEAAAAPDEQETALMGDRSAPQGYFVADEEDYEGPQEDVPEMIVEEDRRVNGMCYIRLMESSEADCRRVAEFFASRGVAILLLRRDNGNFRVYVIERAYPPDQRFSDSAQYYLERMREYGREWKISNGGRGDDLASMDYFQCVRN